MSASPPKQSPLPTSESKATSKSSKSASPKATTETPPTTKGPSTQRATAAPQKTRPCNHMCALIPNTVPDPVTAATVLHPKKDVFVLKVAKVGANGDRRCKMELELVTPTYPDRRRPYRIDTREVQCDPHCDCCCSVTCKKENKWK